jgi:hypothetical protein
MHTAIAQRDGLTVCSPKDGQPFTQHGAAQNLIGFELMTQGDDVPEVFKLNGWL